MMRETRKAVGVALALVSTIGCVPAEVVGSLRHEEDERQRLLIRARASGVSMEVLNAIVPPLTLEEEREMQAQDSSCRASYLWKNGFSWTGGGLVAVAAGSTIVGGIATGNDTNWAKILFGVSAGTLAALGGIFEVVAGVIQTNFADRGCVVRDTLHLSDLPDERAPIIVPRQAGAADAGADAESDAGAPILRSTWGTGDDGG
jgi:hypothetical protein